MWAGVLVSLLTRLGQSLLTFFNRDPTKLDPTPPAKWEPKVLGMNKRDLLQDVLPILGELSPPYQAKSLIHLQHVDVPSPKWLRIGRYFWQG